MVIEEQQCPAERTLVRQVRLTPSSGYFVGHGTVRAVLSEYLRNRQVALPRKNSMQRRQSSSVSAFPLSDECFVM